MGPGPVNAHPRVLRAMSADLLGQFDPEMTAYMNEVMALYRPIFGTQNRWTFLVDGTARSAIEAALVSLVAPGETVLVVNFGRFGLLLQEIPRADRRGGRDDRRALGRSRADGGDCGGHRARRAQGRRLRPWRHLDDHGAAARRAWRPLRRGRRALLCRCHCDHRRHAHRSRQLGRRRRPPVGSRNASAVLRARRRSPFPTARRRISSRAAMSRKAFAREAWPTGRGRASAPIISISP